MNFKPNVLFLTKYKSSCIANSLQAKNTNHKLNTTSCRELSQEVQGLFKRS